MQANTGIWHFGKVIRVVCFSLISMNTAIKMSLARRGARGVLCLTKRLLTQPSPSNLAETKLHEPVMLNEVLKYLVDDCKNFQVN